MTYYAKHRKFPRSKHLSLALILIVFTMVVFSITPAIPGEQSGEPQQEPNDEGYSNQNGTGNQTQTQEQNGTCNQTQTQEQIQNGTCNQTQQQNSTCNQTQQQNGTCNQTQTQEQNGTCNQTQTQEQNGTCNQTQTQQQNGTCDQTQTQTRQQNGTCNKTQTQTQQQNGTCNQSQTQQQNGTGNKTQEQTKSQNGNGNGSNYSYEYQNKQQGSDSEYQWRHQYRNEIQSGAENGTIPLEATFTYRNRHMVHENNHYQSGMELELDEAEGNKVRVRVRAEYHEGKVVVINIEGNVLRFRHGEGAKVYFDGKQIQQGSINEIMNAKGEQAKYVGEIGEGGAQFLVYIPHFSEHTITIESLIDQAQEELFTSTNYMVIGIGILALIGLSGYIFKIGKDRE